MKTIFMQFALLIALISTNDAAASAPCVLSAKQVIHIKRDDLKPGRVLLGLDGSRIVVRTTLAPEPGGQSWYAQMDWEKHQIPASHSPAAAVLHLDTDDQGKRYLCRIDVRDYTHAYVEKNFRGKKPADVRARDIEVIEQTQLTYDARNRVVMAIEAQRKAEQQKLKRTSTACFHYDAKDRFLGASFPDAGSCAGSAPGQIQDRYVYHIDGTLLRKISAEKSIPEPNGKSFITDAARVTVFGPLGQPTAEYVDDSGRYYRRSLAAKANDSKYHAIKVIGSPASFDLNRLQDGKAVGLWQLFSMPSSVANGTDGLYDERYLVARGDKPAIDSRERDRIWKVLSQSDHDMVLEAQGIFLLVPEVSPAKWAACMNPLLQTRADCS